VNISIFTFWLSISELPFDFLGEVLSANKKKIGKILEQTIYRNQKDVPLEKNTVGLHGFWTS